MNQPTTHRIDAPIKCVKSESKISDVTCRKEEQRISHRKGLEIRWIERLPLPTNNVWEITTRAELVNDSEEFVPLNLYDLGYDEGDWDKFCNEENINEEFSYFPVHELKKLRILLCHMREEKKFDREFQGTCAVYKYCAVVRQQVDEFIEEFVDKFSFNDTEKKELLIIATDNEMYDNTDCYNASVADFGKKCIAPENPYSSMFEQIFARTCHFREFITKEEILSTIDDVCHNKFITDEIDLKPYLLSIGFRTPP